MQGGWLTPRSWALCVCVSLVSLPHWCMKTQSCSRWLQSTTEGDSLGKGPTDKRAYKNEPANDSCFMSGCLNADCRCNFEWEPFCSLLLYFGTCLFRTSTEVQLFHLPLLCLIRHLINRVRDKSNFEHWCRSMKGKYKHCSMISWRFLLPCFQEPPTTANLLF